MHNCLSICINRYQLARWIAIVWWQIERLPTPPMDYSSVLYGLLPLDRWTAGIARDIQIVGTTTSDGMRYRKGWIRIECSSGPQVLGLLMTPPEEWPTPLWYLRLFSAQYIWEFVLMCSPVWGLGLTVRSSVYVGVNNFNLVWVRIGVMPELQSGNVLSAGSLLPWLWQVYCCLYSQWNGGVCIGQDIIIRALNGCVLSGLCVVSRCASGNEVVDNSCDWCRKANSVLRACETTDGGFVADCSRLRDFPQLSQFLHTKSFKFKIFLNI